MWYLKIKWSSSHFFFLTPLFWFIRIYCFRPLLFFSINILTSLYFKGNVQFNEKLIWCYWFIYILNVFEKKLWFESHCEWISCTLIKITIMWIYILFLYCFEILKNSLVSIVLRTLSLISNMRIIYMPFSFHRLCIYPNLRNHITSHMLPCIYNIHIYY